MTEFPPLTDKQLEVMMILASYELSHMEDIDIMGELEVKYKYSSRQSRGAVPPLLGSLKKLGLIKRDHPYPGCQAKYGHWSLSEKGRKLMGCPPQGPKNS